MNNISKLDKNNCTGCRMCEKICPVNAINMIENEEGFIEPKIDEKLCVNCGLCYNKCPQINKIENYRMDNVETYAAKNVNYKELKESSSGGIFSALSNFILDKNGVVYGCAFNNELVAEHIRVDNKENLYKLRGSKYVQSNTQNTFVEVKEDLLKDKYVLYSGTPCQIAGLKAYLEKEYEKLITVDLVCHGVPSPKLFRKYKENLEKRYNSQIKNYEFRNKEKNGWGLNAKITFKNGKIIYCPVNLDSYYKSFLKSINYREVCYKCKYSNIKRISDITLADYWGVENVHPDFYDEMGVSAIIINTLKGKNILFEIENTILLKNTDLLKIIERNRNLENSSIRISQRNHIYNEIDTLSYKKYEKKKLYFKKNIKDIIKNLIPLKVKKKLKQIIKS